MWQDDCRQKCGGGVVRMQLDERLTSQPTRASTSPRINREVVAIIIHAVGNQTKKTTASRARTVVQRNHTSCRQKTCV